MTTCPRPLFLHSSPTGSVQLWSEGTDSALSPHEAQCRQAVFRPQGAVNTHTHTQRLQPRGVLDEGISVNIEWQRRCWWPCEVEAVLGAWCWLISTANIQERSQLVIPVKTAFPPASCSCWDTLRKGFDSCRGGEERRESTTCPAAGLHGFYVCVQKSIIN